MRFRQPLDEFPISRRKKFLFVRGARGQFDHFPGAFDFLASARTAEMKTDGQTMTRWILRIRLRMAKHPQRGARRIKVRGLRREEPLFEVLYDFLLLGSLLNLRKTIEI